MSGEVGNNNGRQSAGSLLKGELRSYCGSESLSEEGLRQLIERHGLIPNKNTLGENDFFVAACRNERVTEGIIQCLLEYFPDDARATNNNGWVSPLYYACINPNVTLNIIQLLIDAAPASVRSVSNIGNTPLHILCGSKKMMDDAAEMQILKLLIEKHPEAVRHADNNGCLPIHFAAGTKSPEFCRLLIETYPGSEQITDATGALPLHRSCWGNTVATVEYLYRQYPDAINHATKITEGRYPIHFAIASMEDRENPAAAIDIVRFLLDCDPNQKLKQCDGMSLLAYAFWGEYNDSNIEAGIQIIKIIFDAHPDSVRSEDNDGWMPLHILSSNNSEVDEAAAIEILKLLIEKHPEAVRHAENNGSLPIHIAARTKSPEFCRVLIEAYPGSEQIPDADGLLPLHIACAVNTLVTVEFLLKLYPAGINVATTDGFYPIHCAIEGINHRGNQAPAIKIVKFLLDCNPNVKLQKGPNEESLLEHVLLHHDSNIHTAREMIAVIFDEHPEDIEDNNIISNIHSFHQNVQPFINSQLVYSRQAKDRRLMTTPDSNGYLPLHRALQNNVRLGSIKLLVKGNPSALWLLENNFAMPLHIACEHHDSASVVEYLLDLDTRTLRDTDIDNNTALHYACRGAKHDTIAMLLEKYDAASVSKRNTHGKLPIDLLWGSNEVSDRGSLKYTESIFQLLRAFPQMLTISNLAAKQPIDKDATRNGKKRKFGHE